MLTLRGSEVPALQCVQAAACSPLRQQQREGEAAFASLAAAEGLRGSSSTVIFLYNALNRNKHDLTHANIWLCECPGNRQILPPVFLPKVKTSSVSGH